MKALLLFVLLAVTASIVTADYYCSWKLYDDDKTLKISGGSCHMRDYTYLSTSDFRAFRDVIERVEFENGVEDIGEYAFSGFSKLTSVVMPNSIEDIGNYAFYDCGSLVSVSWKNVELKTIGNYAFDGCSSLTRVYINGYHFKTLGSGAFKDCTSLREVIITDAWLFGLSSIDPYTFAGCSSLRIVSLPSSISYIYSNAFEGCSNLTELPPLRSVKEISRGTFANCTSLESVTIPVNITKISTKAFQGCTNLKHVSIPGTVTTIEKEAFDGCTALEDVIYRGDSDPSDNAFTNCGNVNACVFRTYSSKYFGGITVYPSATDPELEPLFAQENMCNQVVICSPNSGYLVERMNASEWINTRIPCGFGICDNETGNHEWSTCISTDVMAQVCIRNECKSVTYLRGNGWTVILPMSGVKYQDFNRTDFVKTVGDITSQKVDSVYDFASEVDADQNLLSLYISAKSENIAESMKTKLQKAVADPQCATKWGNVLCHAGNITVIEKSPSAADHCYVSLFSLLVAMIISIFSTMN